MTKLTLLELVEALDIQEVSAMNSQEFTSARVDNLTEDDLFLALLRNEGLTVCQEKLLRWAHDIYAFNDGK